MRPARTPQTRNAAHHALRRRRGVPSLRLTHGDEQGNAETSQPGGGPSKWADQLVDPKASQDQTEDELGHEQSLDHRELAVVQRNRLKHERADKEDPPQQPERVAKEIDDEPPPFGVLRVADAGDVLGHDVQRIGQCGQQSEDATHAATTLRKNMSLVPMPVVSCLTTSSMKSRCATGFSPTASVPMMTGSGVVLARFTFCGLPLFPVSGIRLAHGWMISTGPGHPARSYDLRGDVTSHRLRGVVTLEF